MWKSWGATALAILGAIGTVVAVSTQWGFYPVGVIVLLASGLFAALWGLWQQRIAAQGPRETPVEEREHDSAIVSEIRLLVPRNRVEWLRGWDFGGSWQAPKIDLFSRLRNLDDVEHHAFDPDLSTALRRLFDATSEFMEFYALNTFREQHSGDDWRNIGWTSGQADGLSGDERALWEQRRDRLNDAADAVVEAYDALIETARRRHLLRRLPERRGLFGRRGTLLRRPEDGQDGG